MADVPNHTLGSVAADASPLMRGEEIGPLVRRVLIEPLVWRGILMIGAGLTLMSASATELIIARLFAAVLVAYAATRCWSLRSGEHKLLRSVPAAITLAAGVAIWVDSDTFLPWVVVVIGATLALGGFYRLATTRTLPAGQRAWGIAVGVGLLAVGVLVATFGEQLLAVLVLTAALAVVAVAAIAATRAARGEQVQTSGFALALSWLGSRPASGTTQRQLIEKLYLEGDDGFARLVRFGALMATATGLATMGVITDSTAVVIGAMLVAPLMTPLLGTSLALFTGWPNRLGRAGATVLVGIVVAIGLSALLAAVIPVVTDPVSNSQVASRISPTVLDLLTAVIAGIAGAYAISRDDVSDSLPGVAIAIALVPPLCVTGIMWEQREWAAGNGSLLLFVTNALAIILVGGATFVVTGVAPLHQAARAQQRIRTTLASIGALAIIVMIGLSINGARITRSGFARTTVERTVAEWLADDDRILLEQIRVSDDLIVVEIKGPSTELSARGLAADLEEALGRNVTLDLRRIEQQRSLVD